MFSRPRSRLVAHVFAHGGRAARLRRGAGWLVTLAMGVGVLMALPYAGVWRTVPGLAVLLTRQVNARLQGHAHVAQVRVRLPLGVELLDVSLAPARGAAPILHAERACLRVAFWPLLHGRVALADVVIDGLHITSDAADSDALSPWARALSPRTPAPAPPADDHGPAWHQRWFAQVPLEVRHARITHASWAGDAPLGRMHVYDASAWLSARGSLQEGTLSAGLEAEGVDVTAAQQTASEGLGPVALQALDVAWQPSAHGASARIRQLLVSGPSLTVLAGGQATPQGPGDDVEAVIDMAVSGALSPALWRVLNPAAHGLAHSGSASLRTQIHWRGRLGDALRSGDARVHLEGDGHGFAIRSIGVRHVGVDLALHAGQLMLDDVTLLAHAHQAIRLQGSAHVNGALAAPRVGPFVLNAEIAGLDVRAWLKNSDRHLPLTTRAMPRALNAWVHVEGPRAWPDAHMQWQIALHAQGIDALPRRGQPLTFDAHGALSPARATLVAAALHLGNLGTATAAAKVPLHTPAEPLMATLHAHLQALGPLAQALGFPLRGERAELTLHVGGSRAQPTATGLLQATALRIATGPARGPLGDLNVPWQWSGHDLSLPGATLRGDGGAARLVGQATLGRGDDELHASIALDNFAFPIGQGEQARASGDAIVAGAPMAPHAYGTVSWHASKGPRGHAFRGGLLAEADAKAVRLTGMAAHVGHHGLLWLCGAWLNDPGVVHVVARGRELPMLPAGTKGASAGPGVALGFDFEAHGEPSRHVVSSATLRVPRGWLQGEGGYRPPAGGHPMLDGRFDAHGRGHVALAPLAPLWPGLAALRPGGELALAFNVDAHDRDAIGEGSVWWQRPRLTGQALAAGDIRVQLSSQGARRYGLVARAERAAALTLDAQGTWSRRAAPSAHVQLGALSLGDLYPPLHAAHATLSARGSADVRRDARRGWSGRMHVAELSAAAGAQQLMLAAPTDAHFGGGLWALEPLRLDGSAGRLSVRAEVAQWLRVDIDGRLQLGVLLPFVPSVRHAAGEVAFDVSLRGPRHAPRSDVRLSIVSPVRLQPRNLPSELLVSAGKMTLHGDDVRLTKLEGQIEGGRFDVDGQLQLRDYAPTRFAVTLNGSRLPLHSGAIVAESNLRLRIDGDASAPYAIIKGDVDIVSGRFLRKFELRDFNFLARKPSLDVPLERRAPWLQHVGLDVRAKNKDGFDVRIDAGSFAVRSTLESDVHIGGNVLTPLLNGKVSASEGSLRFPHGTLLLRMASLDFDPSRRSRANRLGAELNVLADGEVAPSHAQSSQNFDITLRLDGNLDSITLDLANSQGLGKMDVLALLTTGHANISDLAQGGDDSAKLDAALSIAGSQVAEPMARMAEQLLERRLNLQIELGTEVSQGNVRVTAAKNLHRRLRLETAYSHGLTAQQSNVSTRAQLSFTDRLLLEGRAARDLTGSSTSIGSEHSLQSNLELKLRVLGL